MPSLPYQEDGVIEAPHIVILGAGASIAAYNDWGCIGNILPSMQNVIDTLSLRHEVTGAGYNPDTQDFEDIYDDLASKGHHIDLKNLLESRVYSYFAEMTLPETPTIYDYLILALREKDIIATFNWDPFLLQAYRRNQPIVGNRGPKISFLHGNVMVGVCRKDRVAGINGEVCLTCGDQFKPTKLLYPVKQKNYSDDLFIKGEWDRLISLIPLSQVSLA